MIFLYSRIFSFMKHTNWRFLCAQVWNLGPSTVERAEIEIQIPHQYVLPPVQEIFMRILEPQVSGLLGTLKGKAIVCCRALRYQVITFLYCVTQLQVTLTNLEICGNYIGCKNSPTNLFL
jgi:hypothetical protein